MVPISNRQCCPICRGRGHVEGRRTCAVCHGDGALSRTDVRVFSNCYEKLRFHPLLWKTLRAAIEVSNADFGNIQLYDSTHRTLRIVAHRGFQREFLEYFAEVSAGNSACGAAMKRLQRVVMPDVAADPIFKGKESCDVMMRARALAVQSTPLISLHGQFLGVMSTHYRRTGGPLERELADLGRLTQDLVAKMEAHLSVGETNSRVMPAVARSKPGHGFPEY